MLSPQEFRSQYGRYFGSETPLPIAISYSDTPLGELHKTVGCMFKLIGLVQNGQSISLDKNHLNCGGGKFYTGLAPAPAMVYNFVANKEKYKISPEYVQKALEEIAPSISNMEYLNLVRLDKIDSFTGVAGLIFLVTPDVLSGLFAWANYDQTDINSVQVPWGSGCSQTITALVNENSINGKHCFIGMLDISARPFFPANILSFSIPMSRFGEMSETLAACCVAGAPAWEKLRQRIDA